MTTRLEFGLGLVGLVVAGLALTTLYLRAELRKHTGGEEESRAASPLIPG